MKSCGEEIGLTSSAIVGGVVWVAVRSGSGRLVCGLCV